MSLNTVQTFFHYCDFDLAFANSNPNSVYLSAARDPPGLVLYGHGFESKSLWELLSNISNKCFQKSSQILPQMVKMGSKIVQNRDKIRASKKTWKKVVFLAKKVPNTQIRGAQNSQKNKKNGLQKWLVFRRPFLSFLVVFKPFLEVFFH